ncbi:MAG: 4-hydroxy-tetrahydrodipicolinate synthase [Paludibacteraceae bacterium]|nr:4-hydroxy-tetrahydrodipicolinate synthase [Paludibacteraceae bacterium]
MTKPLLPSLCGLGTALITPFLPDKTVDFKALGTLIEHQIAAGVDYIVVFGTTSEMVTLNELERITVRDFIVRRVAGRVPLVLGIGGNCTEHVICEIKQQTPILTQHFCAILSVCPYYNKPNQQGMFQHFCAIAKASPLPIILYNVPGRTGVNLLPETVARLYKTMPEKIIGVKEASGKLEQIKRLLEIMPEEFMVISGDDKYACELMEAGAKGLISVASNAFPEDFHTIIYEKDAALAEKYKQLVHLLFAEGSPAGIKCVLSEQGIVSNILRLPLVPCTPLLTQEIRAELEKVSK